MIDRVDHTRLVPVGRMVGEDDEETDLLKEDLEASRNYLAGFRWCRAIRNQYYGLGIGGVVCVFLFEIEGDPGVDDVLWVVTGDLPPAYLVTDAAPNPLEALRLYCGLMEDWIDAVRRKGDLSEVFPVAASPNQENANQLEIRVTQLRESIIPAFEE